MSSAFNQFSIQEICGFKMKRVGLESLEYVNQSCLVYVCMFASAYTAGILTVRAGKVVEQQKN